MTYSVNGIDISHWQEPVTDEVNMDGCEFVGIRACYGTAKDDHYDAHEANARKHGAVVIAYLFGVYADGAHQAEALVSAAPHADVYALDREPEKGLPQMTLSQASAALARLRQLTAKKRLLYASESGFPRGLGQDANWVAKWGSVPPAVPWAFWQNSGVNLDKDVFSGTLAQLRTLAGIAAPAPAPQYRVSVSQSTPLYDRPGGALVSHVTLATYTCTKSMVAGKWWYRIVNAGTNRGRYMPAEAWMVVRPA